MTELTGRRARWTSALLLAPGAAALFGATTAWALHAGQQPQPVANPQPIQAPVARPAPSELMALERSAVANQRQLAALRKRMSSLQRQLTSLAAPL
ncbi:MAG: hypothetical protein ABI140_19655, partial [Jatrophihabitantaceae bacterium]